MAEMDVQVLLHFFCDVWIGEYASNGSRVKFSDERKYLCLMHISRKTQKSCNKYIIWVNSVYMEKHTNSYMHIFFILLVFHLKYLVSQMLRLSNHWSDPLWQLLWVNFLPIVFVFVLKTEKAIWEGTFHTLYGVGAHGWNETVLESNTNSFQQGKALSKHVTCLHWAGSLFVSWHLNLT